MQQKKHRFGLSGKLVLAILVAGTIPIVVGLSVAYVKGTHELQEVIGSGFRVLAEESASKVDDEIRRVIAADQTMAQQAAADPRVRHALLIPQKGEQSPALAALQDNWLSNAENGLFNGSLRASWITALQGAPEASMAHNPSEQLTTRVSDLRLDNTTQQFLIRISSPIQGDQDSAPIGWLHRDYDIKALLDPLVYPIRFGDTGHVMLIDNLGAIISCPLLITGSRIDQQDLITRVSTKQAGWITAKNDGHGGHRFSIVGHAPLTRVNSYLPPSESWHMFVWQDSREIFSPARSFLIGIVLAGLLSMGLLIALGYYTSSHIVKPIQKLRREAGLIAGGDLSQPLAVDTGDEIEELAYDFNDMRIQLQQFIGTLEEKVDERTRELQLSQIERERIMEQLIQTEKVAAIGTMASGIGHEINNPLYAIMGMAEAIRDEKDISQCNDYGQEIIKYTKHIATIVKNLSGYIRPAAQHELDKVDINEKITEALAMMKHSLLDDLIEIRQHLAPLPPINAKPEEIQQVFFNIIRNGIQAMHGKGTLEISSSYEPNQIRISICDTGVGISEDNLRKIFDPFFTTKGPDEGEGLGMYIVKQIISKYDGTITLESMENKGTTVTILFPLGEAIKKED